MNFKDFDSALARARAYKLPCVICKLLNPETSIKRRNPFFIMKLDSFHIGITKMASVEACIVPIVPCDIVAWHSTSKVRTDIFRRQ